MIITSTALIKSRVGNATRVVNDLMRGSVKPDKILFFISKEPHNIDKGIKPHEIPKINNPRVEFIYTENIGSLRKIIPVLEMYWKREGVRIILYDDDFGIPIDSVSNLINFTQNIKHRTYACGFAGNLYNTGRDRSKLNAQEKRIGRSIELGWVLRKPKRVDYLSSGLGLTFKPKFFSEDILNWESYVEEFGVNMSDEHFINYQLSKTGTPKFVIPINSCPKALPHKGRLSDTKLPNRYKVKQSRAWAETMRAWRT